VKASAKRSVESFNGLLSALDTLDLFLEGPAFLPFFGAICIFGPRREAALAPLGRPWAPRSGAKRPIGASPLAW
jgi:hypothetical protein